MELIQPPLMSLFELAKHYTGRSAQQSLLIACFSLLEDVCFYFPNENAWVWSCVWRRMLISCQERSLQVSVATAAMQTLANLLPSMLEEMLKCAEDLYGLLDSAHIREGKSTRPRYHRNRNEAMNYESRYCRRREMGSDKAIWKHSELFDAFTRLVVTLAQTENNNRSGDAHMAYKMSLTHALINKIGSFLRNLEGQPTSSGELPGLDASSDIKQYETAVLSLCSKLVHDVNCEYVRNGIYQILVEGLGGKTPMLVVLPCLVDLALEDGKERQNDVNNILTGLLMKIDIHNVRKRGKE